MKQIIVNVECLTIEEKKRVNEALAKIKNIMPCPTMIWGHQMVWESVSMLFVTSYAAVRVGYDYGVNKIPTHTVRQVLEMAGMSPDIGVSVKLDENGVAVMATKRKVRKDFDPAAEYTVDVLECTEAEKKEVQQAFFDAGFKWEIHGEVYKYTDAVQYTNTMYGGRVTANLMYGNSVEGGNMTAKEFLDLVYEPEKKGHVHAELMAQYAEDAKTSKTPWQLWEYLDKDDGWTTFKGSPGWYATSEYRRKPTTHIVNGVEVPELRVKLEEGGYCYLANPASRTLFTSHKFVGDSIDKLWFERGLTYQHTEEGKQAAILHAKAMLGMVQDNV